MTVVLMLLGWFSVASANQDEKGLQSGSIPFSDGAIRLAPSDADYFSSTLHLREQRERTWNSPCWVALRETPIAQKLLKAFLDQWEGNENLAPLRIGFNAPVGKRLRQLVDEMFGQEMFVLADHRLANTYLRLSELQRAISEVTEFQVGQELSSWLASQGKELIQSIPVPTVVVGFAVAKQDRALDFVDQVHGLLSFLPDSIRNNLSRIEDRRGTRLSLRLQAEMIPFQTIANEWLMGDAEWNSILLELERALQDKQVTLTLGQLDEFLVFAISEKAEEIVLLGQHQQGLLEHAACEPLTSEKGKVLQVSYRSDALAQASFEATWNHFFERRFRSLLQQSLMYSDEPMNKLLEPLEEDLPWLDDEIRQHVPNYQGMLQFTVAKEKGWELWQYDRTAPLLLDGSQPLNVLEHCGSKPIAMLAGRHQFRPEWFQVSRKIVRRCRTYLELALAEQVVTGDDARELELVLKTGWPALTTLADLIENKFLPATKEGQHAWVLGSREIPLPIWMNRSPSGGQRILVPEMGTITGLSDKGKFVEGCIGVFGVADRMLDLAAELAPGRFPRDLSAPRPQREAKADEDRYYYSLTRAWGFEGLEPQIYLDQAWAISSHSKTQAAELEGRKNLEVGIPWINSREKLAAAAYLDGGELTKLLLPWIGYGLESYTGSLETDWMPMQGEISFTSQDFLDLLGSLTQLGRWTSITQVDPDGVVVTQTRYEE